MYLAHLDNIDDIDLCPRDIISGLEKQYGVGAVVYMEKKFVTASGYAENVRGEIELLLSSHPPKQLLTESVDDFILKWNCERIAPMKIRELSGGWQRYLSLALFLNRCVHADLAIGLNALHFLAPDRILHIATIVRVFVGPVVFVEMDMRRLLPVFPDAHVVHVRSNAITGDYNGNG